jgi:hypothetical protein
VFAEATEGRCSRVRYDTTNPLALDEILDSIVVESVLSSGLELGRIVLQLHDTYLNTSKESLAYRLTLFRLQNGPSTVRVRVYGDYLQ